MNNCNILRKFDLEAAKNGQPCCYHDESGERYHLAGPDETDRVCMSSRTNGDLRVEYVCDLRMKPLCWVEDKPVYVGDMLYCPGGGHMLVSGISSDKLLMDGGFRIHPDGCSWTKPGRKVQKHGFINMYQNGLCGGKVFSCETEAEIGAMPGRVACIEIHWEEDES